MNSFLKLIQKISHGVAIFTSFLVYLLVASLTYEVFARYLFKAPTVWAFDLSYMLFGTIFMLGSAYTLLNKKHIRTDIFYHKWSIKRQGMVDALMYLFLFFRVCFFLHGWVGLCGSGVVLERKGSVQCVDADYLSF